MTTVVYDEYYPIFQTKTPHEHAIVKCACCEKELVDIRVPEIPSITTYYIFTCPYCGEESFKIKFNKKVYFNPINCKVSNVEYTAESNNEALMKVELTNG